MEPAAAEFITVGIVLAPWGTQGKVKVAVTTDFPQRFAASATVYVNRQPMTIDSTEWHRGKAVIKFAAIDSLERARQLGGQPVEIPRCQAYPLPEGEYYHFQLVDLEVWTTQGELVGRIAEVLTGKSNDSYVVRGDRGEVLIPAIDDVIKSIDLDRGRITIEAIKGLLA